MATISAAPFYRRPLGPAAEGGWAREGWWQGGGLRLGTGTGTTLPSPLPQGITVAFTAPELAHIHATVGALAERWQPPAHLWDQLRHELEVEGHRVRIVTVRPAWDDPDCTARSPSERRLRMRRAPTRW